MECTSCGHVNESDAKFCRECGTKLTIMEGVLPPKGVEFAPSKQPKTDVAGGIVIGVVFIIVGCIIALAIFTTFFSDFGTTIGTLAGGFGETMGNLGSDLGDFFGSWGDRFGNAVGNFFKDIFTDNWWWDLLKFFLPAAFIIPGIILILITFSKRR